MFCCTITEEHVFMEIKAGLMKIKYSLLFQLFNFLGKVCQVASKTRHVYKLIIFI